MTILSTDTDAVARILRDRARTLAREAEPVPPPATLIELIEFGLADERYALETVFVREVHPLEELTPLPCTPAFWRGVVNIRGRILPVIDLKRFFDLPETGITDLHLILLVETHDLTFGLLADRITGVRSLARDTIQTSLPTLTGIRAEYLLGVTAERLVILDAERLAADRRIIVDEEVDA